MENTCQFDDLCKAAKRNLNTAKTFASLQSESLVSSCCVQAYRKLEEADKYAEIDLSAVRELFADVRDACRSLDWQAVKDCIAVVEGFVEAAAQAHQRSHESTGPAKSLSELQHLLQLASWEPPKGFLPN